MHYTEKSISAFQTQLLEWFKLHGRTFPWRKSRVAYRLILTEILLQRTKAETVNSFYDTFFKKYPTWKRLCNASQEELQLSLKPLGLHMQRGARLYALAQEIKKHGYKLPSSMGDIEELPLMGQYIANSIKLLLFDERAPLLDVNMARLLERQFGKRKMSDIRFDRDLQDLASKIVDHKESKNVNWAILDFAAKVCTARNPKCDACIFTKTCVSPKDQVHLAG